MSKKKKIPKGCVQYDTIYIKFQKHKTIRYMYTYNKHINPFMVSF